MEKLLSLLLGKVLTSMESELRNFEAVIKLYLTYVTIPPMHTKNVKAKY